MPGRSGGGGGYGGASGGGKDATKRKEGEVVGEGAQMLGADNLGHKLLSKMGWSVGDRIGKGDGGLNAPIMAIVKVSFFFNMSYDFCGYGNLSAHTGLGYLTLLSFSSFRLGVCSVLFSSNFFFSSFSLCLLFLFTPRRTPSLDLVPSERRLSYGAGFGLVGRYWLSSNTHDSFIVYICDAA